MSIHVGHVWLGHVMTGLVRSDLVMTVHGGSGYVPSGSVSYWLYLLWSGYVMVCLVWSVLV